MLALDYTVLVREIRKTAQKLPHILMRTGPPPPLDLPTLWHLLVPFTLPLSPSPKTASAAQTKIWLLRGPNPEAEILQGTVSRSTTSHLFQSNLCASSPRSRDCHIQVWEIRTWRGTGRWGYMETGTITLEKMGAVETAGVKPIHITITRHPHTGMGAHRGAPLCDISALAHPTKDRPNHHPSSCLCVHPRHCMLFCTLEALFP